MGESSQCTTDRQSNWHQTDKVRSETMCLLHYEEHVDQEGTFVNLFLQGFQTSFHLSFHKSPYWLPSSPYKLCSPLCLLFLWFCSHSELVFHEVREKSIDPQCLLSTRSSRLFIIQHFMQFSAIL